LAYKINANHRRCRGKYVPCQHCGAPSWRRPADEKNGKGLFCSKACYLRSRGADPDPAKSFWMKVDKRGPNGCWLYTGFIKWDGYGWLARTANGKTRYMTAHRYSWILAHGEPPAGVHILHECDNPPCCNPAHLRLGTHQDNMADQLAKHRHLHGERSVHAKLTLAQVEELLANPPKLHARDGNTCKVWAARYGVTTATIYAVLRGRTWRIREPAAMLHPDRVRPERKETA
jgi:hypothetical protein